MNAWEWNSIRRTRNSYWQKFDSIKYLYDVMKNEYSRICSFCAAKASFFVFLYAVHLLWSVVPASDLNQIHRRRVDKPIVMPTDEWIWMADRNVSPRTKFQFTRTVWNIFSSSVSSVPCDVCAHISQFFHFIPEAKSMINRIFTRTPTVEIALFCRNISSGIAQQEKRIYLFDGSFTRRMLSVGGYCVYMGVE